MACSIVVDIAKRTPLIIETSIPGLDKPTTPRKAYVRFNWGVWGFSASGLCYRFRGLGAWDLEFLAWEHEVGSSPAGVASAARCAPEPNQTLNPKTPNSYEP